MTILLLLVTAGFVEHQRTKQYCELLMLYSVGRL